ncbi:double-stranded RNA-binding protein 6-like [Phalaenopsis equestris]|uniref:double-stranded RNA-binding protein 6-like n=1 Tax=Phalaenopsis equestris TaxID=78828 RepID=UPI0009E59444|nr:double-stranded RNA-binding protein 6-like [Phalaenopsis equestris]
MYKNQLQELAQRSCFCLPSYTCIREGPDHAPRFKATVNFNGEIFESPSFCTTLRQAEHAAAEIALNALSSRGPSHSLAARILDETGVYKNLLQEVAQRVGAPLPSYRTVRCGHGHHTSFTCAVELAEILFTGEPAKSKKQAEKNAAMAAWNSLKQLARQEMSSLSEPENNDELEQITVARVLLNYRLREKIATANNPNAPSFPKKFLVHPDKKPISLPTSSSGSKILPMIRTRSSPKTRPISPRPIDEYSFQPLKFHGAGAAAPYMPFQHFRMSSAGVAAPVTIRTSVPVFSAPPLPPPAVYSHLPPVMNSPWRVAPPVHIRPAVPVFAAPPALFPGPVQVSQIQAKEPASRVGGTQVKVCPGQVTIAEEGKKEASLVTAVTVKEETPVEIKVEAAVLSSVQVKEEDCEVVSAPGKEIVKADEEASAEDSERSVIKSEPAAKDDFQELEVLENLRTLEL